MNQLSFSFTATHCVSWPKLKFYIDDDLYHDFIFTDGAAQIDLPLDLLPGSHEIKIELYDKTYLNTVVQDEVIVQDQLVTLENIWVDGVQLPDFFKYSGKYLTNDLDSIDGLTWGINGHWCWEFEFPIIEWILEEKLVRVDSEFGKRSEVFNQKKRDATLAALEKFRQQLNDIDF
jgi:hypothetical protein